MYKFILFLLLIVFQISMLALQLDEERAMHMLFELKHGVNRATHAAAQQVNEERLSQGIWSIDEGRAKAMAMQYLRANLRLDASNMPLPESLLRDPVVIVELEVINAEHSFPYHYVNESYNYEVTLQGPGVIMMVQAQYPRIYRMIDPIIWTVKGTAELYRP